MIKLGEKIKSLRKQKNISQEVFAGYLGVSFQAVSKWENGQYHAGRNHDSCHCILFRRFHRRAI